MVALTILGRDIYRYGIMYLVSFIIGYITLYYIGRTQFFAKRLPNVHNALTKDLDNILILIILGVMVGGRLGYVFIYDRSHFSQNLGQIRAIRSGGMSFIGGMMGVVLSILGRAGYKKRQRNDILSLFDVVLSIAPLGIILGRIGNFLNQEIYGIPVPEHARGLSSNIINRATDRQLFYIYETIDTQLRVNTNFLSALFEGLLMLTICGSMMRLSIRKNLRTPAKISATFILGYGFVRFFLEYLRVDSQSEFIRLFTRSQYFFIAFMILGSYLLRKRRHLSI